MSTALGGTLVTVPFASDVPQATIRQQFESLRCEYALDEILVLSGSPTSMSTYQNSLGESISDAGVPRVTSPVVHATDILNRADDRAILSDALRRELVSRFIGDREFESTYFERASSRPSFGSDLAALMETLVWQGATPETTPDLVEVRALADEFHEWLAEHDHVERGQLISEATDIVETATPGDDPVDAQAILAVDFEEFSPPDRRYLAALAEDRELVAVASNNGSVRRSWIESGEITDHVSFERRESVAGGTPDTRPTATAAFLARGSVTEDPGDGMATVIASETADEQLSTVTDEIERLHDRYGWAYEDIAVGLKQSGEHVTETIQTLEQAGVPTHSATVIGFGDDPAIRELLSVARYLAGDEEEREALHEEHPVLEPARLDELETEAGLEAALRQWATQSNLKGRIADDVGPLEARARFGNVKRSFNMASFLEETPFLDPTWEVLATMLERGHEQSPQYTQTSAIEDESGVRVDHLQALKNGSFRAVFLLNVVDSNYPGDPHLSRLFPTERVAQMPDYPGITDVDDEDVARTFPTNSTEAGQPFKRYHAEHSRRLLAAGAEAASERVYFCFYAREGAGLEERAQPSRFLSEAYHALPWLSPADTTEIRSEQAAEEYLLSLVDRTLADVRRAHSQDISVSLEEAERDLVAIQDVLDASGERGEQLRDAMRARLDLADGRVLRE